MPDSLKTSSSFGSGTCYLPEIASTVRHLLCEPGSKLFSKTQQIGSSGQGSIPGSRGGRGVDVVDYEKAYVLFVMTLLSTTTASSWSAIQTPQAMRFGRLFGGNWRTKPMLTKSSSG